MGRTLSPGAGEPASSTHHSGPTPTLGAGGAPPAPDIARSRALARTGAAARPNSSCPGALVPTGAAPRPDGSGLGTLVPAGATAPLPSGFVGGLGDSGGPARFTAPLASGRPAPGRPRPGTRPAGSPHPAASPGDAWGSAGAPAQPAGALALDGGAVGGLPRAGSPGRSGHAQWLVGGQPSPTGCRPSDDGPGRGEGGDRPSDDTGAVLPGAGRSVGNRTWTESIHIGQAARSRRAAPGLTPSRRCAVPGPSKLLAPGSPRRAARPAEDETVTWVVDTVADELLATWGRLGRSGWTGPTGGRRRTFVPTRSGTATPDASSHDEGLSTYPPPLLRLLASESLRNSIPRGWGQAHRAPLFQTSPTLTSRPPRPDGGHHAIQD